MLPLYPVMALFQSRHTEVSPKNSGQSATASCVATLTGHLVFAHVKLVQQTVTS